MKISLGQKILSRNEECAQKNREFFKKHKILCLNVISSPGAGKTSLLVRTIQDLKDQLKIGVIEGDLETDNDARKILAAGAAAFQIETKGACHLSAEQVQNALKMIEAEKMDLVFIENVGNLVCPSAFDLGESKRVVILSIPEGDDKPAKYPGTFAGASVVLINKIDLLAHIEFNLQRVLADIRTVNPTAQILQLSAAVGEGMQNWYNWLKEQIEK
ncbi:MAG TPA: hydrogenase nickel incorporation protein HypB [Anaerohalosphaeraceae bacterium]|jgi:hydrogenase nickel incorporation protein HypB|nr:hydrogenase nickel incorporation protein HypB [Anaerohalosphaeraceae bacterium]